MSKSTLGNIGWIALILVMCVGVGAGVVFLFPHPPVRTKDLNQGTELVTGVVTKLPIETKSGTAYLEFERETGMINWARVPNDCGDTVAVGTKIEVWVDTLRSDGIYVTESDPPVYAQDAVVKCVRISDPSYVKY